MTLGSRWRRSGGRHDAIIEEAIAAYRAALEERTRERVPLDWAKTQMNLGNALAALGERIHNTEALDEALICLQQAGPVFRDAGMAQTEAIDGMIGRLQDELTKSVLSLGKSPKPGG
jgi:hypothetical protein